MQPTVQLYRLTDETAALVAAVSVLPIGRRFEVLQDGDPPPLNWSILMFGAEDDPSDVRREFVEDMVSSTRGRLR